jgi:CDP-glucose 4,6-dehydratase
VTTTSFWQRRRVLITGHTGFKGAWLALWLNALGAKVYGYALDPPTNPNLFEIAKIGTAMCEDTRADIRNLLSLEETLRRIQPEVVFHLAAQSLVRLSYSEPIQTFDVNVMGTANLLQAIRTTLSIRGAVIVTSDKCYENHGGARPFRETDPMGGYDPYSASKGCAEIVVSSFRAIASSVGTADSAVAIASARSGNVIGGGDWAADRLVPDCIRSFVSRAPVKLRYPQAVRPWLHVLEPLSGYITLAERLLEPASDRYATAFNFGPGADNDANVLYVATTVAQLWGEIASVEATAGPHPPEAVTLRLDPTKALVELGWKARWDLRQTLERTVDWYRAWNTGQDVRPLMLQQLADFTAATRK